MSESNEKKLDCTGLFCPEPVFRTKIEIEKLGIGDKIREKHSISIADWEKKTGRKMKDDLRTDVPLT